jgi:FkbM family methyltransferase
MSKQRPLDLRVADWLIRKAKNYRSKRKEAIAVKNWEGLFSTNKSFIYTFDNDIKINLYKDSILCRFIYEGFENDELLFVKKMLKQGDTFIDIGANIGLFSLYASKYVGKTGSVYAFEPTPETFERLKANCSLNNTQNIYTQQLGLSNKKDVLKLNVSKDGRDAWNTFAANPKGDFAESVMVDVTTLDDFIATNKIDIQQIRMLKIDVEGWEIPVMEGTLKTINEANNIVMMVEFNDTNSSGAGFKCADLYDLVDKQGYTWCTYDLENNCLRYDAKRNHYGYTNLFAVKDIIAVNNILNS